MGTATAVSDVSSTRESASGIDVARPHGGLSIGSVLPKMVAATHQSPLKITQDFVALSFGAGKISFKDYVQLRLFDGEFWQGGDRRTVAGGRRMVEIHQTINNRLEWWGVLDNKAVAYAYLNAHGFRTIPLIAIYYEDLRIAAASVVNDRAGLRGVLTTASNYPMFGKPVEGLQSLGSIALRSHVPERDSVETFHGESIGVDALIDTLQSNYSTGYLFQRFVAPHAAIQAICGARLATVRVVTLLTDAGPTVFRACWKIPAGRNMADNFWRPGNLLAQVDPSSGTVLRVVSGCGFELKIVDRHPDTDAALVGFAIPQWPALVDMTCQAARLMRHVPLIGWDMAVDDDGPLIVEMNERPDMFLPQLADRRGVLDPEILELMKVQARKLAERKQFNRRTFKEL